MQFSFDGAYTMPGVTTERLTWENTFWFGERHQQLWTGMVVSGASRDSGNSPTTILRSGLIMGRITATNKLTQWDPTEDNGAQNIFGILDLSLTTQRLGSDQDRWLAYIMMGGTVKADRLLVPGNASLGISGDTYEHLIRAQLHRRFIFSDKWEGNAFGGWKDVVAKTDNYPVTEDDNNTLFTNRGDNGAITFTLPATAKKGLRYGFYVVADQNLTVTAGTADTLVAYNNATADSVSFETASTKIGGFYEVIGDGTGWLVIPHNWASAADASQITTVTDS